MYRKTFILIVVLCCFVFILPGCSGDNKRNDTQADNTDNTNTTSNNTNSDNMSTDESSNHIEDVLVDEPKADKLDHILQESNLNGFTLNFKEAYLWRDFMPISPPDGKPLAITAKVEVVGKSHFPKHFEINKLWIFNGDDKWEAEVSGVGGDKDNTIELSANNGPKWQVGSQVDVVVRVEDGKSEEYIFLRLANQTIQKTS